MQLLPEITKRIEALTSIDTDAFFKAAEALDDAGLSEDADKLREYAADVLDEIEDARLARQELNDGGF